MLKTHKKVKLPLILTAFCLSLTPLFQSLIYTSGHAYAEESSISTKPVKRTLADIQNMQDITPEICANTPEATADSDEHQYTLKDSRDQKEYYVAKLADGNCWMTQNLAIDLTGKTLTSADSDVSSNWSPVSAWGTTANTVAWQISTTGSEHTSYGGYYSWQAATANTAPVNSSSAGWPEASGSICPRGWELPTGNTGQFKALVDKGKSSWTTYNGINGYWLGGTGNVAGAAFFPAGGYVNNGSLSSAGGSGYYWSSTANNASSAYILSFYGSGVNPSDNSARYLGFSVRCVAPGGTPTPDDPNAIYDPNASVTIDPVLTLEVNKTNVNIEPTTNRVNTGEFVATVTSNVGYKLTLSSNTSGLVGQDANNSSFSIPAIGSDQLITPGENGWGIRSCKVPDVTDSAIFTDCPQNPTTAETTNKFLSLDPSYIFAESNTGGIQPTTFQVGIGVSSALPSGTYGATVTVTASQK